MEDVPKKKKSKKKDKDGTLDPAESEAEVEQDPPKKTKSKKKGKGVTLDPVESTDEVEEDGPQAGLLPKKNKVAPTPGSKKSKKKNATATPSATEDEIPEDAENEDTPGKNKKKGKVKKKVFVTLPDEITLKPPPAEGDLRHGTSIHKQHFSTITFFINDWKAQTFQEALIVPDPVQNTNSKVEFLMDTAMSLYVVIILLVAASGNTFIYLMYFLQDSFIADEAKRFFSSGIIPSIWPFVFTPFIMAAGMIIFLAYHELKDWSTGKHRCVQFFRYSFLCLCLGSMVADLGLRGMDLGKISGFVRDSVKRSFQAYVGGNDAAMKKRWEFTQLAFECCGVDSFKDFEGTALTSKSLRLCADPQCKKTLGKPVVEPGYPFSCCNLELNKICMSGPRKDQVWPRGCMEQTVKWIRNVISVVIAINLLIILIAVATIFIVVRIDRYTFHDGVQRITAKFKDDNRTVIAVEPEDSELNRRKSAEELGNAPEEPDSQAESNYIKLGGISKPKKVKKKEKAKKKGAEVENADPADPSGPLEAEVGKSGGKKKKVGKKIEIPNPGFAEFSGNFVRK